jgi:hypothetical protein
MSDSLMGVFDDAFTATYIPEKSDRMTCVLTVGLFGATL